MIKRAAGWLIQGDTVEGEENLPRRMRLFRQVLAAIQAGQLPAGSRLPSARQLAREWGVARGTVDDAFAQLQADGWVERRVGKGTFVATSVAAHPPPAVPPRREPNLATQRVLRRLQPITADPADYPLHELHGLRLRPQVTDISRFPLAVWRRLIAQAFHESKRHHLSYGAAAGTDELRAAAARHLALARALPCSPRQVLVVNGPLSAFELVCQVLLAPGAHVYVGEPNHISTFRFFNLLHIHVHAVPVDHEGLDVQAAMRLPYTPAAIVVQPMTHYPNGARLNAQRRQQLLRWADQCGAWVIEMEFLGEIAYDQDSPATLLSQDRAECVLFAGSFSSVMFASLRLSYMVVPERLSGTFAAVRGMMGEHSPVGMQLAMAQFIDEGHLATHVRVLREVYGRRRDALHQALQRHGLLPASARPVQNGINMCLPLPSTMRDTDLVAALAARRVAPLALSMHAWQLPEQNALVLGFGGDNEAQIEAAVAEVAQVVKSAGA